MLRDDGMVAIASALRGAEGKNTLDGIAIDPALKSTLERLMPIYQTHWWPEHDRANREWIAAIVPLVDRHGAAISQSLARVYGVTLAGRADARGPVSRRRVRSVGSPVEPSHHDLSSDPSYRGYAALEMVFHESLAWTDSSPLYSAARSGSRRAEGHSSTAVVARRALLHRRGDDDA